MVRHPVSPRSRLTRFTVPGESAVKHELTPNQARMLSWAWDGDFKDWASARGLLDNGHITLAWDKLPADKKRELEAIWDTGHDRVTRQKLGLTVDD